LVSGNLGAGRQSVPPSLVATQSAVHLARRWLLPRSGWLGDVGGRASSRPGAHVEHQQQEHKSASEATLAHEAQTSGIG